MILSSTGWSPTITSSIDYAGKLAASVTNFFSGANKEEAQKQTALRDEARRAMAAVETERVRQETAKVTGFLDWQRAKSFIAQWWWLFLIIIFIVSWRPVLRFFGIKTGYSRTRTPKRRTKTTQKTVSTPRKKKSVTRSTGRGSSKSSTKGFSRRLKGRLYTDPQAWSRAMRRLRK